jgi:hypothetical protein
MLGVPAPVCMAFSGCVRAWLLRQACGLYGVFSACVWLFLSGVPAPVQHGTAASATLPGDMARPGGSGRFVFLCRQRPDALVSDCLR